MNSLMVGLGGFIGANLRYWAGIIIPAKGALPITFFINIIGALLIGLVSGWAMKSAPNPQLVLFLKVGLCGGFTTFSSFSFGSLADDRKREIRFGGCLLRIKRNFMYRGCGYGRKFS